MGGYYYTTKQGDMWDYIAWLVYGKEEMMEVLMAAEENRELLAIYMFSAGTRIWCPLLETASTEAGNDLPAWR